MEKFPKTNYDTPRKLELDNDIEKAEPSIREEFKKVKTLLPGDTADDKELKEEYADYLHAHRGLLSDEVSRKFPTAKKIEEVQYILGGEPKENLKNMQKSMIDKLDNLIKALDTDIEKGKKYGV